MQKLFYNGTILTMHRRETPEAVLIEDGMITETGSFRLLCEKAPRAKQVDLCGRTMMPAFIDAHSHLSSTAHSFLHVSLENTSSFHEISEKLNDYIRRHNTPAGEWIVANGYDHNHLQEQKHPDRAFLDTAVPKHPVVLQHKSGHMGVFNSKALDFLDVTPETLEGTGGSVQTENGRLTGYMEENPYFSCLKKVPAFDEKKLMDAYSKAQEKYASHGITTVQDGMMAKEMIPMYKQLQKNKLFYLDIVGYPGVDCINDYILAFPEAVKKYNDNFKIGGMKVFLDGSPQGRTAWMLTPYLNSDNAYFGYGTMTDKELDSAIRLSMDYHMQLLAHCNGDAAADQFLRGIGRVYKYHPSIAELKPVMIHAQLLRTSQLPEVKRLGVMLSFFMAHVYYWGDIHIQNFGLQRASAISPAKSALEYGIPFTMHQDSPVIEPNMPETVWCAVNRMTKAGVLLGKEQRIDVYTALKAVTINAAFQYSEADIKGTIEKGKLADLVILDKNPLRVCTDEIKDIRVLETIRKGETVFVRN